MRKKVVEIAIFLSNNIKKKKKRLRIWVSTYIKKSTLGCKGGNSLFGLENLIKMLHLKIWIRNYFKFSPSTFFFLQAMIELSTKVDTWHHFNGVTTKKWFFFNITINFYFYNTLFLLSTFTFFLFYYCPILDFLRNEKEMKNLTIQQLKRF